VLSYKRLRGDDAAPGSASAYRITVRQLEALVRLGEALARLHLSQTVDRDHVKEVSSRAGWPSVCLVFRFWGFFVAGWLAGWRYMQLWPGL
jgi:hypothetical protein